MTFDAFISYSSKDKTAADAACAMLEGAGVRCWIAPRDIRPGGEYGAAIIDAIDQCQVMVLIFSSNANESRQIHREIERAVSKGVTIVPLRIDEVVPTKSMEYFLGAIHWLDALTPPIEKHLQQLAETVKAILKVDSSGRDASVDGKLQKTLGQDADRFAPRSRTAQMLIADPSISKNSVRKSWLFPALGGGVCVALLAVGVWLYQSRVDVPTAAPNPASPRPAPKPAEAMANWAGNWAGVWFARSGSQSTVTIAIKDNSIVGTTLWRETDDSESVKHRADGTLFNCKVNGNTANCELAWDYTDPAKDLKNHATGNLALDGEHLTGEFHQDEAEPTWRKTPYPSGMHVGAVWQWDLVRRK
jgi:hypothetical protein